MDQVRGFRTVIVQSFSKNAFRYSPVAAALAILGCLMVLSGGSSLFAQSEPAPAVPAVSAPVAGNPANSGNNAAGTELVLQDMALGGALGILADQYGVKLEAHIPLEDPVNTTVKGTNLEDSLNQLLAGKPYMWALDGKTLHVFRAWNPQTQATTAAPALPANLPPVAPVVKEIPQETRIITLKNRRAEEVRPILEPLLKDVKIVPDIRANALLMSGTAMAVDSAASMAAQIDGLPPTRILEDKREFVSEVFALEYINDFDDLTDNLNLIMYGSKNGAPMQSGTADQNPVEQLKPQIRHEYFLLDRDRKILMITCAQDKMTIIREYFKRVNTPLPQVLIEAHIVALDTGFERNLGINWNMVGGYKGPTRNTGNPLGIPQSTSITNSTQLDPSQGFIFGKWDLSNLTAVLEAAQNQNKGRILSQPRLLALSGKDAAIRITTKYPYKQSTTLNQTGTTENVTYADIGITLTVTPQVNLKSGSVVLKLSPEVSDLVGFRNDAPIITGRRTDTTVEVKDGETVVIGGLLRDENMKNNHGVPLLKDIPVLGEFFRFSTKSNSKSNLIVLITPRIVDAHGQAIRQTAKPDMASPAAAKPMEAFQQRIEQLKARYQTRKSGEEKP